MIDQIAIRRRAGFVMLVPAQWHALDRNKRDDLLAKGAVEFLSKGQVIDPDQALLALGDGVETGRLVGERLN